MNTDQYHSQILALIEKNGALGVNAISNSTNIPLSTVQKYMHRQSYFKMNSHKKWDLPENIVANEVNASLSNFDTLIASNLTGITSLSEMLITQIKSAITLLSTQKPVYATVADRSVKLDEHMDRLNIFINNLQKAIKEHMSNVPEDYLDLMRNLDISKMCIYEGLEHMTSEHLRDITDLLLGDRDILTDDSLKMIEKYQKV